MRVIRFCDIDSVSDFPVRYILKNDVVEEFSGCCPRSLFCFFWLLGAVDGKNSEFFLWLQAELKEDPQTQITSTANFVSFMGDEIFHRSINSISEFTENLDILTLIENMKDGAVVHSTLLRDGKDKPAHCVVFYIRNGFLFADDVEISLDTFSQMIFCHELNMIVVGKRKARV